VKAKNKGRMLLSVILLISLILSACSRADDMQNMQNTPQDTDTPYDPDLPDTIRLDENGVPVLKVYVLDEEQTVEMDIESYLRGVLAGEMKNDWPLEALKAQAILARTFVVKFLSEKQSKYEGADISTDIEEAQAYDAKGVNERIRQAVDETRGLIITSQGEPIYAWFHAHSGGKTATAKEGLSYKDEAPYTQTKDSGENNLADEAAAEWKTDFSADDVIKAAREVGVKIDEIESVAIGERGESGRAQTLLINEQSIPANEMRIALGSSKMRSTLLDSATYKNGTLTLAGKGYGHGVGMSQWGAYAMAEAGKDAAQIVHYYFANVDIVQKWQ